MVNSEQPSCCMVRLGSNWSASARRGFTEGHDHTGTWAEAMHEMHCGVIKERLDQYSVISSEKLYQCCIEHCYDVVFGDLVLHNIPVSSSSARI